MKNGQIFATSPRPADGSTWNISMSVPIARFSCASARAWNNRSAGSSNTSRTMPRRRASVRSVPEAFLHHRIRINPDGTSIAPAQLPNDERKRRISEAWVQHLRIFCSTAKRPVIAHRLVFSMSIAQHDALVSAGINPDQVLHDEEDHAKVR